MLDKTTIRESLDREGALRIARIIESFWRSRGHENVRAEIVMVDETIYGVKGELFYVRSNLDHRGLPARSLVVASKHTGPNGRHRVCIVAEAV